MQDDCCSHRFSLLEMCYRLLCKEDPMDRCYKVMNECLTLLDGKDLPPRQKLRVETQLLRIKMVLLNPHPPLSFDHFKGLCEELLGRIRALSDRELENGNVEELHELIEKIIVTIQDGDGTKTR